MGAKKDYLFDGTKGINILRLKKNETLEHAVERLTARGWNIPPGVMIGRYQGSKVLVRSNPPSFEDADREYKGEARAGRANLTNIYRLIYSQDGETVSIGPISRYTFSLLTDMIHNNSPAQWAASRADREAAEDIREQWAERVRERRELVDYEGK